MCVCVHVSICACVCVCVCVFVYIYIYIMNIIFVLLQDDNTIDVLELLVHLMAEHPASMVPSFDKKQGIRYWPCSIQLNLLEEIPPTKNKQIP